MYRLKQNHCTLQVGQGCSFCAWPCQSDQDGPTAIRTRYTLPALWEGTNMSAAFLHLRGPWVRANCRHRSRNQLLQWFADRRDCKTCPLRGGVCTQRHAKLSYLAPRKRGRTASYYSSEIPNVRTLSDFRAKTAEFFRDTTQLFSIVWLYFLRANIFPGYTSYPDTSSNQINAVVPADLYCFPLQGKGFLPQLYVTRRTTAAFEMVQGTGVDTYGVKTYTLWRCEISRPRRCMSWSGLDTSQHMRFQRHTLSGKWRCKSQPEVPVGSFSFPILTGMWKLPYCILHQDLDYYISAVPGCWTGVCACM